MASERDPVDAVATGLRRAGLRGAALVLVDMHREYAPLAGHGVEFVTPMLRALVGPRGAAWVRRFASEDGIRDLTTSLEAGAPDVADA